MGLAGLINACKPCKGHCRYHAQGFLKHKLLEGFCYSSVIIAGNNRIRRLKHLHRKHVASKQARM